jgi:hypothetical protein
MAVKKQEPPGKAEPPEGTPGATDGQPDDDELQRRRAAKAAGRTGTSVSEQVANGNSSEDEPSEEELFPLGSLEGDSAVTLKTLLKARTPVEISASMGTAAVPIKGSGFFDPEQEITLLVRVLPGGPVPVATRKKGDERAQIEKWRITQPLTPIYVQEAGSMYTREQVLELFHEAGVASSIVSRLLGEEPSAAAGE